MCVDLGKLLSVVLTGQRRFPGSCALDVPWGSPSWAGLVSLRDRLRQRPSPQRGHLTGPNPTVNGSKIHLIVDRRGLPLSIGISAANPHDSQALFPPRPSAHVAAPT